MQCKMTQVKVEAIPASLNLRRAEQRRWAENVRLESLRNDSLTFSSGWRTSVDQSFRCWASEYPYRENTPGSEDKIIERLNFFLC